MDDWTLVKVADFIDFNPRESIAKGAMAKKVGMEHLQPFTRDIPAYEVAPFKGGSKFRNGDTLMARITPCLENGKTAQVNILDDGEVGFGSTEFIVLRAKPGISDKDFIYYLAMSSVLREKAIKSMVGSSGRQRVQQGVLNNTEFYAPPLVEQQEIGRTLRLLDDKITNNTQINNHLEQMAQAIFKSWFVDFEPFGGAMPTIWQNKTLDELCSLIAKGIMPKYDDSIEQIVINQKCIRNHNIDLSLARQHKPKKINEKWLKFGDILINSTGEGTLGRAAQFLYGFDNVVVDSHVTIVRPKEEALIPYLGQWCLSRESLFASMSSGSTGQTDLPRERVKNLEVILPDNESLTSFSELMVPLMQKRMGCIEESARLAALRDRLLPRLMSGELSVADVDSK